MSGLFAKGKRGVVRLEEKRGKKIVVKKKNPKSKAVGAIEHEYEFLKELNKEGIGPKVYGFEDGELRMEYIDGTLITDYIEKKTRPEVLDVIRKVFFQLKKMDDLGINKAEMTNPYKHIIIRDGKPTLIDFERCRKTESPQNVTQFCQFLMSRNIKPLLSEKGIRFTKKEVTEAAKAYKKNYSEEMFRKILDIFTNLEIRVLEALKEIPEGKVTTYGAIADYLDTAPLAVGQALKNNPWAPEIPCHRVVQSDGSIGGYSGETEGPEIWRKIQLLGSENVEVEEGKIKNFEEVLFEF